MRTILRWRVKFWRWLTGASERRMLAAAVDYQQARDLARVQRWTHAWEEKRAARLKAIAEKER